MTGLLVVSFLIAFVCTVVLLSAVVVSGRSGKR